MAAGSLLRSGGLGGPESSGIKRNDVLAAEQVAVVRKDLGLHVAHDRIGLEHAARALGAQGGAPGAAYCAAGVLRAQLARVRRGAAHEAVRLADSRDESFPGLERNGWKLLDLFPGITLNLRGSALRIDTVTPIAPDRVLIEFRGLGLRRDTREQRYRRVRDHNTIWGPFGRNLPEDLLGVVNQGLGMPKGSESMHVLHGRHESNSIHDEVGLRAYYTEWSRRMGRDAKQPEVKVSKAVKLPQLGALEADR